MSDSVVIDRLALRRRPSGPATMYQRWRQLLFLHQRVDAARLAPHLPPEIELDTHDGHAWVGVVPFRMEHIRHRRLPEIPGLRATLELNVRTYVHHRGVPGVWFFSLDATHPIAVWGARRLYHLPYFRAAMEIRRRGDEIAYHSRRRHRGAPAAELAAVWRVGNPLPEASATSLAFFLTERYCLYTAHRDELLRGRIFHPPWPLRTARLLELRSSMVAPLGLPEEQALLAHYAESLEVEIFPLERVCRIAGSWHTGSRTRGHESA